MAQVPVAAHQKKLGWQSLTDEGVLKRLEVGHRVPAEATAQRPNRPDAAPDGRGALATLDRSDGTRSGPSIVRSRVAAEATSRTEPRTTVPGQATFRPLARRSW